MAWRSIPIQRIAKLGPHLTTASEWRPPKPCSERNLGKRNDDIVRDFFGEGLSPEEVAARGAAKEALYRQMVSGRIEQMLVPGLRDFLERHRGWPTALASNAEPENVALVLDGAGLRRIFRWCWMGTR